MVACALPPCDGFSTDNGTTASHKGPLVGKGYQSRCPTRGTSTGFYLPVPADTAGAHLYAKSTSKPPRGPLPRDVR